VDLSGGRGGSNLTEGGYAAIGALTQCVVEGKTLGRDLWTSRTPENYYPATLRAMTVLAAQMRFPSCLR